MKAPQSPERSESTLQQQSITSQKTWMSSCRTPLHMFQTVMHHLLWNLLN